MTGRRYYRNHREELLAVAREYHRRHRARYARKKRAREAYKLRVIFAAWTPVDG